MQLYAGNDENLIDVLNMGQAGGILTLSHVFGPLFRRMVDEPEQRAAIHESLKDAFKGFGIAPLAVTNKAALNLLGIGVGGPRLPYVPLDESETASIRALLEHHGLRKAVASA